MVNHVSPPAMQVGDGRHEDGQVPPGGGSFEQPASYLPVPHHHIVQNSRPMNHTGNTAEHQPEKHCLKLLYPPLGPWDTGAILDLSFVAGDRAAIVVALNGNLFDDPAHAISSFGIRMIPVLFQVIHRFDSHGRQFFLCLFPLCQLGYRKVADKGFDPMFHLVAGWWLECPVEEFLDLLFLLVADLLNDILRQLPLEHQGGIPILVFNKDLGACVEQFPDGKSLFFLYCSHQRRVPRFVFCVHLRPSANQFSRYRRTFTSCGVNGSVSLLIGEMDVCSVLQGAAEFLSHCRTSPHA